MKIQIILLALVLSLSLAQISVTTTSVTTTLSDFSTQINNYFGCKLWLQDNCVQCSQGYFFNKNSVCCQVDPLCEKFNLMQGTCEDCYEGYSLVNNKCVVDNSTTGNAGCAQWSNSVCIQCSQRYYFSASGVCSPVSNDCYTWKTNGSCDSCYFGYIVQNGNCVIDTLVSYPDSNPLCKSWNGSICLACASKSYFVQGVCTSVSALCNTFDKLSGQCLTCYIGYTLVNGTCTVVDSSYNPDLGCADWDWLNLRCNRCSKNWVFNSQNKCAPVSNQCNGNNLDGSCSGCYVGYDLISGQCVQSSINALPTDLYCSTWNWATQTCLKCSFGYYFDATNKCTAYSDECSVNDGQGKCTQCYPGYSLQDNKCVLETQKVITDVGCSKWNWNTLTCLSCSQNWVTGTDGKCTPISDQCKSFSQEIGQCAACYSGYDLVLGQCIISSLSTSKPSDQGCNRWDWWNQICLSCSNGWIINQLKHCKLVNSNCKTYDPSTGACTQCYNGWTVKDGNCVESPLNSATPSDLGCALWSWDQQVCLNCSTGYIFNSIKQCSQVSDLCHAHDDSGRCISCYKGYDLQSGACVASSVNLKPIDIGCGIWNWDSQTCLSCSRGWLLSATTKTCSQLSDQCKTFDDQGVCKVCYDGYDLVNGLCSLSTTNVKPADGLCSIWDWKNQICLKCSQSSSFNQDKVCIKISDLCKTADQNGACLSCYSGYDLLNGACSISILNTIQPIDFGCATWDWANQICLKCSSNYVFNTQKVCIAVSDLCRTFGSDGLCLTCFKGYDLSNSGACIISANSSQIVDLGCSSWDWDNQICNHCAVGWVKNTNNRCVSVSDQCRTYDSNAACASCYSGYELNNGVCAISAINQVAPSDVGCARWDWVNQICLSCSNYWVFDNRKVCIQVNPLCKTYDQNGKCLSCYNGFIIKGDTCEISVLTAIRDPGCARWDWVNQVCQSCAPRWAFNANKVCVQVNDNCANFDIVGNCQGCYRGWNLVNGACVQSPLNIAAPTDRGCRQWDWWNQVCTECSIGWVFDSNKLCVAVSDLCNKYLPSGECQSCYNGYVLSSGKCVLGSSNSAVIDVGCGRWDWTNQICLSCSFRWFKGSNGMCQPVSNDCNTWNVTDGSCLTCYTGWIVSGAKCILANPTCKTTKADGTCATCWPQYIVNGGTCVTIASLANLFSYYSECCPEKLSVMTDFQISQLKIPVQHP